MQRNTKVALIGDVHITNHKKFGGPYSSGVNRRCDQVLTALSVASLRAQLIDVDALIILGDLFDSPKPSPQVLKCVQDIVETIPTIIISGNHDQCSDEPGDHALGPLMSLCEVIDSPDLVELPGLDLLLVPYQAGDCRTWLPKETKNLLKESRNKNRLLCFHAGIVGTDTPIFLKDSDAAIGCEQLFDICKGSIQTAFAGHWHTQRKWEFFNTEDSSTYNIIQAGAFTPTGFADLGLDYGFLYTYDTARAKDNRIERHQIPGPRFLHATLDDDITTIAPSQESTLKGLQVYLRLQVDEKSIALGKTVLKAAIESGTIVDGELDITMEATKAAAIEAATVTRAAATLAEAIERYVSSMPLKNIDEIDGPESRDSIKRRTNFYMETGNAD